MRTNVFTYGSLMFPEVWEQVVRGSYSSCIAVLGGHARYAVEGASYPGMIARQGASVEGVLYRDVDAQDLARLDAFEGSEYRRDTVRVRLKEGGHVDAQAYLFTATQRLRDNPWRADTFDVRRFLQTCPPGP